MEMVNQETGESLVPRIPEAKQDSGEVAAIEPVIQVDLVQKVDAFFMSTAPHDLKSALLAMVERIHALEAK